jgi:hypothetical protein
MSWLGVSGLVISDWDLQMITTDVMDMTMKWVAWSWTPCFTHLELLPGQVLYKYNARCAILDG